MTDGAVHANNALEDKMNKCLVNWQSSEQYVQKRNAMMPKVLEAANATLLVMNLSHVPVTSVSADLQALDPEKVKEHKGARVTFLVLKVLSPGWTWINGVEREVKGKGAAAMRGGVKEAPPTKDKLNAMLGEHLVMHSYITANTRGTVTRAGRANEYLLISPGMVLSMMVWGRGFMHVFKEQLGDDLRTFDIGIIQLGTKSATCNGATSGNILEVKSYVRNNHPGVNLFSARLLPPMASSLLESAEMRSRFLEGSNVEEGGTFGEATLNQGWLKGTISSTVSVVKVSAQGGTFAIGPDDTMRFHVAQPLADLPCAQMTVHCQPSVFGNEADKDWVCKLLNVLALVDAVELVVVLDSYKANKMESEGEDSVLEGVARIDTSRLIAALLAKKPHVSGTDVGFVKETFGDAAKAMAVFKVTPEVSVVFDTRLLTKKRSATLDGAKTTLVHPAATWERGHAVHFFFSGRLVHYAVVPLAPDCGLDGSKHVLSTIAAPVKWDELDVEVEAGAPEPEAAPLVPDKEKKRKQRPAATEGDA